MKTAEEILEKNRMSSRHYGHSKKTDILRAMEEYANQAEKKANGSDWISVEDLPNDCRDVEVYIQMIDCIASHCIAAYEDDEGWCNQDGEKLFGITYWRELKPPKP